MRETTMKKIIMIMLIMSLFFLNITYVIAKNSLKYINNPYNTYDFYDDFDNNQSLNNYVVVSNCTVSNGDLLVGIHGTIYSRKSFRTPIIMKFRMWWEDRTGYVGLFYGDNNTITYAAFIRIAYDNYYYVDYFVNGTHTGIKTPILSERTTYHTYEIQYLENNVIYQYELDNVDYNYTVSIPTYPKTRFYTTNWLYQSDGQYFYIDYVIIQKPTIVTKIL